ncbi:LuxR C-terminal-related transcriptional regulator [Scandinavium sp. M-37]|jgi:DNA-binding CsgD family transcriptional regulator|uniref:LuxR C-terminal-related transcriptional regulator n=1 Tax=Scandinavium sp. M-37 TaxID=3373077 RepID=UPI003746FF89
MDIIIVSDNYYLLSGIQNSKMRPIYLPQLADVQANLSFLHRENRVIIATECIHLRKKIIDFLRRRECHFFILLPDIGKNNHFKLGNVIFASMNLTPEHLMRIATTKTIRPTNLLTLRESQVLKLFHLRNISVAKLLSISEKTTSGYRMSIQYKLKMRSKNSIAMLRVQKSILQCGSHTALCSDL